jgi:hypothetical protein
LWKNNFYKCKTIVNIPATLFTAKLFVVPTDNKSKIRR